jgi:8-oxo-dGTP pyrophosphatase MutT (NUDIX family)
MWGLLRAGAGICLRTIDAMPDQTLTHAGGVVRREDGGQRLYLLVRASRPPFDWVLPKGHIEEGETPEVTACREVREEAGVDAEVVQPVGDLTFDVRGRTVHVRYFAMRYRGAHPPLEERDVRWCSLSDCEQLLLWDTSREMVRAAARLPIP